MRVSDHTNRVRIDRFDETTIHVQLVNEDGQGLAGGALSLDIPKDVVPAPMRQFGRTFRIRWRGIWPEDKDSAEALGEQAHSAIEYLGE
jgi:hypothetical protein